MERETEPLEKVTLRLYKGDSRRIQELYPKIGSNKAIRHILRAHLNKVEATFQARQGGLDVDIELEGVV